MRHRAPQNEKGSQDMDGALFEPRYVLVSSFRSFLMTDEVLALTAVGVGFLTCIYLPRASLLGTISKLHIRSFPHCVSKPLRRCRIKSVV